MTKKLFIALTCLPLAILASELDEHDFFNDTILQVDRTVDLVADYHADGSDRGDDSAALQLAIDDMTALPHGGKIAIPAGIFHLENIKIKSNVHIEIDPEATLKVNNPNSSSSLFLFGLSGNGSDALVTISNVSIRASSGRYTVDISDVAPNPAYKVAFANCKNVDNFLISDFNIVENFTRLSSFSLYLASHDGQYFRPRNGIVKNGDNLHGHYGYGMVQVQVAYNILFKDLSETGGVTLRLESGGGDVAAAPQEINIDQVYARNISITNGHYALMMGAHTRKNGHVDADGIYAVSSLMAVAAGPGYASSTEQELGYTAGYFSASSVIRNVHAVFGGTGAEYKTKNWSAVPPQLRGHISTNAFAWDSVKNEIYPGPSIAAAMNGENSFTFENVTMEGFEYQPLALMTGEPWEDLEAPAGNLYSGCNEVPAGGVIISQTNLSLNVAKSAALSAAVSPADATDSAVNWISDNPSVAIVSESGVVTAVGEGVALITARTVDWGWFDSCEVTVSGGGGGSWTELTQDDFEAGWGAWTSGGADAFLSTNNAVGTQCVNLQDKSASACMALSNALDLTSFSHLKLEFSLVSSGFGTSHELVVEFSDDGGASWSAVKSFKYDYEFDNGEREEISLMIDEESRNFSSNANVRIRCQANWDADDVYIDNVVISAFAPSGWGRYVSEYKLSADAAIDTDHDGRSDLLEYACGGNPTNRGDTGISSTLIFNTNDVVSIYNAQVSHANPGISYQAEWTDDLVAGSWSDTWMDTTNHPTDRIGYVETERTIDGKAREQRFVRIMISQP